MEAQTFTTAQPEPSVWWPLSLLEQPPHLPLNSPALASAGIWLSQTLWDHCLCHLGDATGGVGMWEGGFGSGMNSTTSQQGAVPLSSPGMPL